jgi:hypothetical protein
VFRNGGRGAAIWINIHYITGFLVGNISAATTFTPFFTGSIWRLPFGTIILCVHPVSFTLTIILFAIVWVIFRIISTINRILPRLDFDGDGVVFPFYFKQTGGRNV